jgi:ABC-type multidrug transport system fused ATPase/permease subunit
MNADKIRQLEKLLDRELSHEEIDRFRRIKDILHIRDNDSVWDILAAMEYQRVYYEELPAKIAGASAEILQDISVAAEKEIALAQSRLADNVVEQAKKLSVRINMTSLLPMGLFTLVSLLAYGSLLLWAGWRIGSGQAHPPELILRVPSCMVMGGLCVVGGIFCGAMAAKEFSEGRADWRKHLLTALAFLLPGAGVFSLAL